MKYFLLVVLVLSGCLPIETEVNSEDFKCAWSDKYQVCFCGNKQGFETSVLTWVPDKACGK